MEILRLQIEARKRDFSHYNIVRMREAVRYFSPEKLEIFIKIPFLVHINCKGLPGYLDISHPPGGIWNFEKSGFYKEAVKIRIFPKSVLESLPDKEPSILGFYHIGSLGTFTQSRGSDFDYWVIIDKKRFTVERYQALEKKLDDIVRFCREDGQQEVSFFIMDQKDVCNNDYSPFEGEETLSAPKVFLKEEFYRTYLMVAGKTPLWSVWPDVPEELKLNSAGIKAQALVLFEDIIDLGQIDQLPAPDIFKGILWHICKSKEDPVKALIKATMIFSYGFSHTSDNALLCEIIRKRYAHAGIDDVGTDPYKVLFDRILNFHRAEAPEALNLMKNAIFFRLCGFPDVKMPEKGTPKHALLSRYIKKWRLKKHQVTKLLSYAGWSESEKLLLEKAIIHRLAAMYNKTGQPRGQVSEKTDSGASELRNLRILKHKVKERLNRNPAKIESCSIYIKRRNITRFEIIQTPGRWQLNLLTQSGLRLRSAFRHGGFAGILGWIMENQLYKRSAAVILKADKSLFESKNKMATIDQLYLFFAPLKPLSDKDFNDTARFEKMLVILNHEESSGHNRVKSAEFLTSNTWGELYYESIKIEADLDDTSCCAKLADKIVGYGPTPLRLIICQFSDTYNPAIVYLLKKAYYQRTCSTETPSASNGKKILLDKL